MAWSKFLIKNVYSEFLKGSITVFMFTSSALVSEHFQDKILQAFPKSLDIFFFYIFNIKVYNNEITDDTTYELLYDTTNTVPGGAIYHDYPLAFNINLRNTTHTTTTK